LLIGFNIYTLVSHSGGGKSEAVATHVNPISEEYFTPPPSI
jgi:hypothetical protein